MSGGSGNSEYYYDKQQEIWAGTEWPAADSNNAYQLDAPNFGSEAQFATFDYSQPLQGQQTTSTSHYSHQSSSPYSSSPEYPGTFIPNTEPSYYANENGNEDYENEPPLLEELGINFDHILQKTVAVLNPLKDPDAVILLETDLTGPLVFCLAFGSFLLLSGKIQFGYIYGIGVLGCLGIYILLNLMSTKDISLGATVSVLGYCLLPMVVLSGISILLSLQGIAGTVVTLLVIFWCAISASKLFVTALTMNHQQPLVAYPCALMYGVFALLTMF